MEAITILNALSINEWAFKSITEQNSSIDEAIKRSLQFPETAEVAIITDANNRFTFPDAVKVLPIHTFDSKSVFNAMFELAKEYRTVFFADADAPFLDTFLAAELFKTHKKYKAEYTFADGYPKGLAPEILDTGLVKILAGISDIANVKNNRTFIFDSVKQNINSYDIETLIAPDDISDLRLEFNANSKRNFLLCNHFKTIDAKNYAALVNKNQAYLFTLPAYYAIEISAIRSVDKIYQPKINDIGSSPFLNFEKFKTIIDKIVAYSDDAVISFSIFGEPFCNKEIFSMIEYVLQQKNLSLLLETSGTELDIESMTAIHNIVERYNAASRIFWIVMLDAASGKKYAELTGTDEKTAEKLFKTASENVSALDKLFSGQVFPQFVRMNENEDELETFYRFWKEKINNVLIQKYDNLAGQIPDRRVADISPIKRNVCWHLKRDMYILQNGDVLVCREDAYEKNIAGNIFSDDLKTIREKIFKIYCDHTEKNYKGLCEHCDEYYTYNF